MMSALSGTVIAVTGALQFEPSMLKKWVEANGGKWSPRIDTNVTHLVASRPAWKTVTDPVKKADELGIHIVSYDWLEDSLHAKRKLPVKKYTFEAIKKAKKMKKELKKLGALSDSTSKKPSTTRIPKPSKSHFFGGVLNAPHISASDALKQRRAAREAAEADEKAIKAAKKASASGSAQVAITIDDHGTPDPVAKSSMPTPPPSASSTASALKQSTSPAPSKLPANTTAVSVPQAKKPSLKDLYHYYLDSTGFEYKITLVRSNSSVNQITRYQISILESHTLPHTYCTFVQYAPPVASSPEPANTTDSHIRNPLLAFLRPTATPQQPTLPDPAEQARLRSLIIPPTPTTSQPYKTLICPMNSPFPAAWRAFRHTFRSLTLLSWEERFDIDAHKAVQTARAKALNIEPYIYAKPKPGMPIGLSVQEAGLFQGNRQDLSDLVITGDAEDGYVRNQWGLPDMDVPLSMNGVVGQAIWREEEKLRKEERLAREKQEEMQRLAKEREKAAKRQFRDGPLFNGPTGRPQVQTGYRPVVERAPGAAVFTNFGKKGRPMPWGKQ